VRRTWIAITIAAAVGCAGKQEVTGPPKGSCTLAQNGWSCANTTNPADAGSSDAVDAGSPGIVPQCPSNVGAGSCSQEDTTTNTTNPNEPAHVTAACFECTDDGLGVVWTCISQSWQSEGVYSCQ
jgi:hypothetical protein